MGAAATSTFLAETVVLLAEELVEGPAVGLAESLVVGAAGRAPGCSPRAADSVARRAALAALAAALSTLTPLTGFTGATRRAALSLGEAVGDAIVCRRRKSRRNA